MSTNNILKHISSTGPITALNFVQDDLLLVGCGYSLRIYTGRGSSATLQHEARIFARERIHGIISTKKLPHPPSEAPDSQDTASENHRDDAEIFLWGGRSLLLTTLGKLLRTADFRCQEVRAPDWIFHAAFVQFRGSRCTALDVPSVVFVTAHNELVGYKPSIPKGQPSFSTLACPERTLLYSASLLVKACPGGSVIVNIASGLVFGLVQYWTHEWKIPSVEGDMTSQKTTFHAKFVSHEGSIFGVAISEDLECLASCSDDRSIRLWNVSSYKDRASEVGQASEATPGIVSSPLSIGWGHQARIWGMKFLELDPQSPDPLVVNQEQIVGRKHRRFVLSWSEDTTSKLWSLSDGKLDCLKTYKNIHLNKNIWSLAVSPRPTTPFTIATGGADGALALWKIDLREFTSGSSSTSIDEVIHETPGDLSSKVKDYIKDYCILSRSGFLATIASGKLLKGSHSSESEWNLLNQWDECRNSSVLAAWRGAASGIAAIGDKEGRVGVLDLRSNEKSDCTWYKLFSSRVCRLLTSMGSDEHPFLLSICFNEPERLYLQRLSAITSKVEHQSQVEKTWELTTPSRFIPTSFSIQETSPGQYICILGSRFSAVLVYTIEAPSQQSDTDYPVVAPLNEWGRIHSNDAITSITIRNPSSMENGVSVVFLSTGRDGSFAIHRIDVNNSDASSTLTTIHKTCPTLFTMIEGAYIHSSSGEQDQIILYGFHGTDMVFWNETKGVEVGPGGFNCGSGNRTFEILFERNNHGGADALFVYTRAQKCHTVIFHDVLQHPQITPSFHGREVRAVAISPPFKNKITKSPLRIITTGSDDTSVRLSILDAKTKDILPLCVQKVHSTCVYHLEWTLCGGWLFSCGAMEEVYSWKFTIVRDDGGIPEVGLVKEAELVVNSPTMQRDADLRVLGGSCLAVDGGFLTAFVYSDSSIKLAFYYPTLKQFTLVASGFYKTSCLLHVKLLRIKDRLALLTAGTDGHVTIWDLANTVSLFTLGTTCDNKEVQSIDKPIYSTQIHQNSIKSLDISYADGNDFLLLLTGGDDTALALNRVTFIRKEGGPMNVHIQTEKVRRAHASAITGAKIIGDKRIVSAGVDQRVKIWDILVEGNLKILEVEERYVCVPDVAGLEYYEVEREDGNGKEGRIVIVGVGMEVLGI